MAKNKVYLATFYLPQNPDVCFAVAVERNKEKAHELIINEHTGAHIIILTRVKKNKPGLYPRAKIIKPKK